MSALIAALIAALGPVLVPLLLKWLESLFKKVAPSVEASGDAEEDAAALVDAALAATPRRRVFKRALLSRVREHAGKLVRGDKLSAAERTELSVLAGKAKGE